MRVKNTKFFQQKQQKWVLIDAKDKVLGRLSTRIAKILQGKHKATYTPNAICGDRVVVVNAKHIKITANKSKDKLYDKYTGYPSGRKLISFKMLMEKNPTEALQMSVKGMLPKNHLGRVMLKSLRVYPEADHDHKAQNPELTNI